MTEHDASLKKPAEEQQSTILVVDDQAENLDVLAHVLHPRYRVRVALSGEQALRVAKSEPIPDLVLLDIMMPEMDGFEVLARLKRDPETSAIPVIFVTALDSDEDEARGLESGAVDYITKPIRPAIVLARVNTHIALKTSRDELESVLQEQSWLVTKLAQQKVELEQALRTVREYARR